MPGDSEATKRRLLDAAAREFAAYGIAGARVDRIAESAKANKAQIYHYFGSKDELFDAMFDEMVALTTQEAPLDPLDLPGYAARLCDGFEENPYLGRLAACFDVLERYFGVESVSLQFARSVRRERGCGRCVAVDFQLAHRRGLLTSRGLVIGVQPIKPASRKGMSNRKVARCINCRVQVGELVQSVTDNDEMDLLLMDNIEVLDDHPARVVDHELQRGRLSCYDRGGIGLDHQHRVPVALRVPCVVVASRLFMARRMGAFRVGATADQDHDDQDYWYETGHSISPMAV